MLRDLFERSLNETKNCVDEVKGLQSDTCLQPLAVAVMEEVIVGHVEVDKNPVLVSTFRCLTEGLSTEHELLEMFSDSGLRNDST